MSSASEILLSAKELSCRKTNQQSQRYLTGFLRQMDLEKKMVGRDWDHRMKTFVAQRRKFMPAVWEYKDRQRPRTVATPGERAGYHVIEKSSAPILPRHNSPNIPMEWTLCASYRVLKTGERIRRPLPNTAHTVSARPVPTRRHRVVPRKAMSAPAQRSNPTSFLITQQDNADELDKLIRANDVSANDVKTKYDVSNNAFANNSNNDVDRNKVQALRPKPPSSGRNNTRTVTSSNVRRRVRPVSTTRANKLHTNEPAVSGLKRCNSVDTLSSCSSSSLKDSMGSFTLLKKLTGAEHFT